MAGAKVIRVTAETEPMTAATSNAHEIVLEAADGLESREIARATSGVVEMERKLKTEKDTLRTIVDIPIPASAEAPKRPTNAVSIRESNGSSARAPSAGRARARIWRVMEVVGAGMIGGGGGGGGSFFDDVAASFRGGGGRDGICGVPLRGRRRGLECRRRGMGVGRMKAGVGMVVGAGDPRCAGVGVPILGGRAPV